MKTTTIKQLHALIVAFETAGHHNIKVGNHKNQIYMQILNTKTETVSMLLNQYDCNITSIRTDTYKANQASEPVSRVTIVLCG